MKRLIKNNNGSTLLLVIIAMAFIGILGSLILSLTMTNIQMKQVDFQAKVNFNETETVLHELQTGLEKLSSECMYKAYNYLLLHYSDITKDSTKSLKSEFDTQYINALVKQLSGSDYNPLALTPYYYMPSLLKSYLITSTNPDDAVLYDDADRTTNFLKVNLDTTNVESINSVVLKAVKIKYLDSATGYETFITTDINLESPNLNFDSASIYPEFTKYALIADKQVNAQNGTGMSINGNIYAGDGGILVDATNVTTPDPSNPNGFNLKINGSTLITRGDITSTNYAKLFIGNESTMNIWAENIVTLNNISAYSTYLNIKGNIKVADDLMLKAKNSQVVISGNYHGFNFNRTNTIDEDTTNRVDSKYSSAIFINGLNSSLDMSGVNNLIVKGRAFVSRKSEITSGVGSGGSNDIMTGESVAVKSNQTAYFVPNEYIWCGHNPITQTELDAKPVGTNEIDFSTAPADLRNLLTLKGYTEYYYQISGMTIKYYYLEFKDQESANTYFSNYASIASNKAKLENNAKNYLVDTGIGVKLSPNLLLAANALTFDTGSNSNLHKPTLGKLDDSNNNLKVMLNDSIRTAYEYRALQLGLIPTSTLPAADFRLMKAEHPLFKTILKHKDNGTIDVSDDYSVISEEANIGTSKGFIDAGGLKRKEIPITIGSNTYHIFMVDNPGAAFLLSTNIGLHNKGIIVATGDVVVNANYEGMIIAGGTIHMASNSVSVTSNPSLVQEIFSNALQMERTSWSSDATKRFTHYFTEYSNESAGVAENIDQVDISSYITYENWKKNLE